MRKFDLLQPTSLIEAIGLLADYGEDCRLLGGGAMLAILLRERLIAPRCLISVLDIPGLGAIEADDHGLAVGAAATLRSVEHSQVVARSWPVLAEAAHLVGNVRVRNVGTVGGHLVQADPHLDLPPVLAALDARVVAQSRRGSREIRVVDLFTGYYETCLQADELVVRIEMPMPRPGLSGAYLKYCPLSASDWPLVGVAAFLEPSAGRAQNVRIVAGSVAERPLRVPEAESLLEGEALRASAVVEVGRRYAAAADPLDDVRGSADYKRDMTAVFVRRALQAAAARAGLIITEDA